jgi:hypothetical protein
MVNGLGRLYRHFLLQSRLEQEAALMDNDRIYFARRAAEEQELAVAANDPHVAEAHRQLQRAYLERASVGDRSAETQPSAG